MKTLKKGAIIGAILGAILVLVSKTLWYIATLLSVGLFGWFWNDILFDIFRIDIEELGYFYHAVILTAVILGSLLGMLSGLLLSVIHKKSLEATK